MSRSALWHQEKNVQRRQAEADMAWEQVVEEGRNNRAKNLIPLWGPDDSFHFEPMLLNNIKKSSYFVKICHEINDWTALVDEIYYKVDHMEPFSIGKSPSMGFCLLLRLLTMRSTTNQMSLMLNHQDSPYIRAIGLLYLRYSCVPEDLFRWFEPYLYDDEPIQVSSSKKSGDRGGSDNTIGSFARNLLSSRSRDYYGTMLPRLPIQIERNIQVKLLQAEKVNKRAESHFRNKATMDYFQKLGSKVWATYEDEDNPLQWYKAEVDRVVLRSEDGSLMKYPRFVVTFTEYGNTETVTLGEMDVPDGKFHTEDLSKNEHCHEIDEVLRRERETVTASGRDYYSRPPTTKRSLMGGGASNRRGSSDRRRRSPSPRASNRSREYTGSRRGYEKQDNKGRPGQSNSDDREAQKPPTKKRSPEELAAIQEKKRKLMAKYG